VTRLAAAALLAGLAALAPSCSAAARHRVLSVFFDGVPEPAAPDEAPTEGGLATAASAHRVRIEHEPYASGECSACHDSSATNRLVVPAGELCFQCHDFELDRAYVHGPLASGGCLGCHDPHASTNPHLLLSASDGFCLGCHQRQDLFRIEGHLGDRTDCTRCHEAHMSDRKYLLRATGG